MARDLGLTEDIWAEHAIQPTDWCNDCIEFGQCCPKCGLQSMIARKPQSYITYIYTYMYICIYVHLNICMYVCDTYSIPAQTQSHIHSRTQIQTQIETDTKTEQEIKCQSSRHRYNYTEICTCMSLLLSPSSLAKADTKVGCTPRTSM